MAKIDYELLLDNALKNVVREALVHAQINGLGDGMHFNISDARCGCCITGFFANTVSGRYDNRVTVFV